MAGGQITRRRSQGGRRSEVSPAEGSPSGQCKTEEPPPPVRPPPTPGQEEAAKADQFRAKTCSPWTRVRSCSHGCWGHWELGGAVLP